MGPSVTPHTETTMKRTLFLAAIGFTTTFGSMAFAGPQDFHGPQQRRRFDRKARRKDPRDARRDDRQDLRTLQQLQNRLAMVQTGRWMNRVELASIDRDLSSFVAD